MIRTTLENKWDKYWKDPNTVVWHKNIIGVYHVSAIGCDHQHLEPEDHSGPCLRQTFYQYVAPVEKNLKSKGNLNQGTVMHKEAERIYQIKRSYSIIEFPLAKSINKDIAATGSVDVVDFLDNNEVLVLDFKTSSEWTFPKGKNDRQITHFDQVYIYAALLQNFVFGNTKRISHLKVVYLNKHDQFTGEQEMEYVNNIGLSKLLDFSNRCKKLHGHLVDYRNKIYSCNGSYLPNREPMKWCKYCDYKNCCRENVIGGEALKTYTKGEVGALYAKETGKSPIWRGNYTKAYKDFEKGYKVE